MRSNWESTIDDDRAGTYAGPARKRRNTVRVRGCRAVIAGAGITLGVYLLGVAPQSASAWCVYSYPFCPTTVSSSSPCYNCDTHEEIAERAAAHGGNPNKGKHHDIIKQYSSAPDCEDDGWEIQAKHTSIAGSHAVWTSTNIASALAAGKWKVKKKWGVPYWVKFSPNYKKRARFIGRASHYLQDGGQPYHDQVVQSVLHPPGSAPEFQGWMDVHLAFEAWAHDNGDFNRVNNASTWFSWNPYSTAKKVSNRNRGWYAALLPVVDLSYDSGTKTLDPSSWQASVMRGAVNTCWSTIGSGLKGVYKWNTGSSLAPEWVDTYVNLINDSATGYASTLQPHNQTRLPLATVQTGFMSQLMTTAEFNAHKDDCDWWDNGDINVVLQHPFLDDPVDPELEGMIITVVNAVEDGDGDPIVHPDYSLHFLAYDQIFPDPGTVLEVTAVVVNEGGIEAPVDTIELRVDDETVDTVTLSAPIPSLTAVAVSLHWEETWAEGEYNLKVVIDPDDSVDEDGCAPDPDDAYVCVVEDNEEDNTLEQTIYVGVPAEHNTTLTKRFDPAVGGTFALPSGDLEVDLLPGYSSVSPYISGSQADGVVTPFEGARFVSPIYSLSPAGRPFDLPAGITLSFDPPSETELVGLYRLHEGDSVEDTSYWVEEESAWFDFVEGEVTFSTNELGIFAVLDLGDFPAASEWGLVVITLLMLTAGTLLWSVSRRSPESS